MIGEIYERILVAILKFIKKAPDIFMKILFMPLIVGIGYVITFCLGLYITNYIYKKENVVLIILSVIITSILSFGITVIIDFIYTRKCSGEKWKFKNWFEWSHLIIMYLSGLLTFIIAMKPVFNIANIKPINISGTNNAIIIGIFFIATFNYYFYKAFIINKDISIKI